MLHKHKFPLPLREREKKVQQRAVKGSMSGWERRGWVAGRRRPEWQRAGFLRLPFARLVDLSHFVVQASSPAVFGAGQRPAPQALIKLFLRGSSGSAEQHLTGDYFVSSLSCVKLFTPYVSRSRLMLVVLISIPEPESGKSTIFLPSK